MQEFFYFHAGFAQTPTEIEPHQAGNAPLAWQPLFDVTIVADQIRSPYNVGSILRLIDNVGFAGLVHASAGLDLNHARLRRAARGAERWIPVRYVEDLPAWLQQADVPVVALENCKFVPPPDRCLTLAVMTYQSPSVRLQEACVSR